MEIGGREVDTRALMDIALSDTAYDYNTVKFNKVLADDYVRDLDKEGEAYVKVLSVKEAKAIKSRMDQVAKDYLTLKAMLKKADVKDDDGDHSDHEDIHMSEYDGKVVVKDDQSKHEEHFDSWKDACDYVLALHEDERFVDKGAREDEDDDLDDHESKRHDDDDDHDDDHRGRRHDDDDDDDHDERAKKAEQVAAIIRTRQSNARHAKKYQF